MKPEAVKCPICGGAMKSRANSKTGQRFWGCATFPDCRGTRNTDGESPSEVRNRIGCDDYDDADADHPGNPRFYGDN